MSVPPFYETPDDWSNTIPQYFLALWFSREPAMMELYRLVEVSRKEKEQHLTSYAILSNLRLFTMSRPKGKSNVNGNNAASDFSAPVERKLVWANIHLSDQDKLVLGQSTVTSEYVACYVTSLADDGWKLSVGRGSDGKSINCSGFIPHPRNSGILIGISAFGSTVRNAQLAFMYKYCELLGETLDNIDSFLSNTSQRGLFG